MRHHLAAAKDGRVSDVMALRPIVLCCGREPGTVVGDRRVALSARSQSRRTGGYPRMRCRIRLTRPFLLLVGLPRSGEPSCFVWAIGPMYRRPHPVERYRGER